MRQRTKVSHLEALMDITLGTDWRSIYKLDKDMLGYTIKRNDGKHSGFGGRYSAREMYIYLSGIRDFMVETHQL